MIKGRIGKAAVAAALATVCAFGATACGGSAPSDAAATVNGTAIAESEITNYIESVRAQFGYTDADSWAQYLSMMGMTPDDLRTNILDSLIEQELVRQYAGEKGVTADAEEIQSYVDQMRANFDSDEAWATALSEANMTEDDYRASIETALLQQGLTEKFQEEAEIPEEDLLETAKMYASYIDGSKRSSHILFSLDDRETAQSVLDRIRSGELDFAEAAKEYSIDSSADNGGDVGWDATSTFVTEYQSALDALEVDQVSDLVESQYGYHIIKCTDHFVAPDELTSLDQIPEDFRDIITDAASATAVDEAFDAWLEEMRAKADIVKNEMPADVPYNVDMSAYQQPEEATSDAAAASGEASEASASAESASASASSSSAAA